MRRLVSFSQLRAFRLAVLAVLVATCVEPLHVRTVASVEVVPPQLSLTVGSKAMLVARVTDVGGLAVPNAPVDWTTSNANVATVASTGEVTGVGAGAATITATSNGIPATSAVTVSLTPVASVSITPTSASVEAGQTTQLSATARDAGNNTLAGRAIAWSSSNNGIATVSTSGLVSGVSAGSVTITATSEGKSASANVTVTLSPVASVAVSPSSASLNVGQNVQLSATTTDTHNSVVTGRQIGWSSSNTSVATVSASGLVSAIAAGSATITATSEGKSGTSSITVTAVVVPVASVSVTPATSSLDIGQTVQLTATPRDASNNALSGRTISWSSSNTSVATVSSSGLVSAVAAGSATITASSEGKSGTASVTVVAAPAPVASVTVTPATASVNVGQTVQLTATTKDASNNTLTGRAVSWSSSNTGIATVSSNGLVTAVAAGGATITATSEGKNGTSAITVNAVVVPVASVSVSPATASVDVGQTVQLTATTKDASNNTLSGRTVTWSSSNNSVATVSSSGLVSGVAAGSATITATSEGKSGTSAITVNAVVVPVSTVTVSPATASVTAGQTVQLTATTKDASNNVLTGRTISWSSSNTSIATVSSSGLVSGVAAGSATITATSEGKSGTSAITVNAVVVPVATVTVAPPTASVIVGSTVQLTATTKDANGATLTGRTVTWTSSSTSIARVNSSGLVTAVAAGSATITATSEGKTGTSAITVTVAPVATVTVTPSPASVSVGQTVQLTATTRDASNNVLTGRTVTWSSSNTSIASVSSSGVVTGVATGSVTITATSEGKSGTASVNVTVASADPVLVGAGDIASCNSDGDEATAALLDNIAGTVFTAGDNVYDSGLDTEFADCYDPSWGRHKARTRPAPGNHETYGTTDMAGYFGYFGASAGPVGKGYYSYNLGSWHIIVLNSNEDPSTNGAMVTWLRADLAANPATCTAAIWHYPRFSSGDHGSDASMQPLWQALYDANADLILNGHDHDYERFAPQTPSGVADAARGLREFVIGTGGASHYTVGTPIANSVVQNEDTFGVLKLTLHASSYDWQFIPVAGSTFTDSGTGTCH